MIHQMGEIFPIGDSDALAEKMISVLGKGKNLRQNTTDFSRYQPEKVVEAYEALFEEIRKSL